MLFLGHIAIALILADATKSDRKAAVVGNLVPDVIDKTAAWIVRITPGARWLAHGLPFFGLASVVARFVLPDKQWRGFVVGYAGHLASDLYDGGRLPWLVPFRDPRVEKKRGRRFSIAKLLLGELFGVILILRSLSRSAGLTSKENRDALRAMRS